MKQDQVLVHHLTETNYCIEKELNYNQVYLHTFKKQIQVLGLIQVKMFGLSNSSHSNMLMNQKIKQKYIFQKKNLKQ
jgi:hypothetical protein